jgi:hypothetical protein
MLINPNTKRLIKKGSYTHRQLVRQGLLSDNFKSKNEVYVGESKEDAILVKERLKQNMKLEKNEYLKIDQTQKRVVICKKRLTIEQVNARASNVAISVIKDIQEGVIILPDLPEMELSNHLQQIIDQRLISQGVENDFVFDDTASSIPDYQILESECEESESSDEGDENESDSDENDEPSEAEAVN